MYICRSIGSVYTCLDLSVYRFCLYLSRSVGLSVLSIPIYICRSIGSVYTCLDLAVYRFCLYLSISGGLSVLSIPIYICRSVSLYLSTSVLPIGLSVLPIPIHICSAYWSIGSAYTYPHLFYLSVYRFCLYLSTSVLPIGLSVLPIPIHICSTYRSISYAYTYPHLFCLSVYRFCLSIWKRSGRPRSQKNETPPVNPSINNKNKNTSVTNVKRLYCAV